MPLPAADWTSVDFVPYKGGPYASKPLSPDLQAECAAAFVPQEFVAKTPSWLTQLLEGGRPLPRKRNMWAGLNLLSRRQGLALKLQPIAPFGYSGKAFQPLARTLWGASNALQKERL